MSEIGVIDTIARALVADLPAEWREVSAVYRATTSYAELDADVVLPSGETQLETLPDGLEDHFEELRREMYQPGKGTWLTAKVTVTSTGHFATDFDYDSEPAWSIPVDWAIYPADLAAFPRDAAHTPDWLK
ncbi:antitoxin YezG family protein [Kribbella sp. NBC_00482]|uniref:immunity protein YezG family protein n=1 Tax=Kribbella sp. NBC_00482 TaxID=2975968 RepID=UPI002E16E353